MAVRDFEVEVNPGLHCWNFVGGKPLTVDVTMLGEHVIVGPYDSRGCWTAIRWSEFFQDLDPVRNYPEFYKFIKNDCILRCEARKLCIRPSVVPKNKVACELLIRNHLLRAILVTNETIGPDRCGFELELHSLEVKQFEVVRGMLRVVFGYSIIIRPSVQDMSSLDELKENVFSLERNEGVHACCLLHFAEPGSLHFVESSRSAVYMDPKKDKASEAERVYRVIRSNSVALPSDFLQSIWNHPAIQKDRLVQMLIVKSNLKVECSPAPRGNVALFNISAGGRREESSVDVPSALRSFWDESYRDEIRPAYIFECDDISRFLRLFHRILHAVVDSDDPLLNMHFCDVIRFVNMELSISRIKSDPLCYTDGANELDAAFARILVS